jgi:hypothetical protein
MQTSFEADLPLHAVNEMWLLGIRYEPGRRNEGLPPWMHGVKVVAMDATEYIHDVIERLSAGPYLDLLGTQRFSEQWTIAAP